jgi:hypothetical protein
MPSKVVRVTGKVRASGDGEVWQMLKAADVLKTGMSIQTAKDSAQVDIQLGEAASKTARGHNAIRLYENTAVILKKLSISITSTQQVQEVELELRSGRMLGAVNNLSGTSEYTVQFPGGMAGIRGAVPGAEGTVYVLDSGGVVTVLAGTLVVATQQSGQVRTQLVKANQRFDVISVALTPLPPNAPEQKLWPRK